MSPMPRAGQYVERGHPDPSLTPGAGALQKLLPVIIGTRDDPDNSFPPCTGAKPRPQSHPALVQVHSLGERTKLSRTKL